MDRQPENLISVIIPVYNVAPYLARCIDSVLQNTYQNLEVICVNDGSADESPAILQSYAASDHRVRLIDQENRGLAMARNAGMDAASGDYIAFVDSDDWVHPQYFELLLDLAVRYGADISACRMVDTYFDKRKECSFSTAEKLSIQEKDCQVFDSKTSIIGRGITGNAVMWKLYRSDLLKEVRFQNEIRIEDLPFCLETVCAKENIRCVYALLDMYYYCRREGSLVTRLNTGDKLQLIEYYYRKGIDAEKQNDSRRAYAFFLHAMGRGITLRYQVMYYPELKEICHQLVKRSLSEFLKLDYPDTYEKLKCFLLGSSPALYRAAHLIRHPRLIKKEIVYWKKAQAVKKSKNSHTG